MQTLGDLVQALNNRGVVVMESVQEFLQKMVARAAERAAKEIRLPYLVEFRGTCPQHGGWRTTLEHPARLGFATMEEAEDHAAMRNASQDTLTYRAVERRLKSPESPNSEVNSKSEGEHA